MILEQGKTNIYLKWFSICHFLHSILKVVFWFNMHTRYFGYNRNRFDNWWLLSDVRLSDDYYLHVALSEGWLHQIQNNNLNSAHSLKFIICALGRALALLTYGYLSSLQCYGIFHKSFPFLYMSKTTTSLLLYDWYFL